MADEGAAVTSGEKMVWAVAFGTAMERQGLQHMRTRAMDAAIRATEAVKVLRAVAKSGSNDEDVTAMLQEMTGVKR